MTRRTERRTSILVFLSQFNAGLISFVQCKGEDEEYQEVHMKAASVLIILFAFLSLSEKAVALDYESHLGLGANVDTYKDDLPSNFELEDDISLAPTLGYKGIILWGNVGLRTGAFFEWKKVKVEDKGANDTIDLTAYYAAIPLNLQLNLNDKLAVFGGISPRILLSKTCEDCGNFDDDSNIFVNYVNAGVTYEFGNTFSMDFIFNHAQGENFEDLKINTAQVLFLWRI